MPEATGADSRNGSSRTFRETATDIPEAELRAGQTTWVTRRSNPPPASAARFAMLAKEFGGE